MGEMKHWGWSGQRVEFWVIWVDPEKLKKIFEILIFHIKKLRNNSCEYILYRL
jgi:hypothetical protein